MQVLDADAHVEESAATFADPYWDPAFADRRPRLGRDTDHRTLPAEVGWLAGAVHLDKGCYRGQGRWRGCTTSAGRPGGLSCSTWTASPPTSCPPPAHR